MQTPMNKAGTNWAYKDSYYECKPGCGRTWQTKALKAAMELQPIPEAAKLRDNGGRVRHYNSDMGYLPDQLLKPPRVGDQ